MMLSPHGCNWRVPPFLIIPFKKKQSNAQMICDYQGKICFFHHPDSWEMRKERNRVLRVCSLHLLPGSHALRRSRPGGRKAAASAPLPGESLVDCFIPTDLLNKHTRASPQCQSCAGFQVARDEELLPLSSKMSPSGGLTENALLSELEKWAVFTRWRRGRHFGQRP